MKGNRIWNMDREKGAAGMHLLQVFNTKGGRNNKGKSSLHTKQQGDMSWEVR
jgi:hypothetical protein